MAVHVLLSQRARKEALSLMLSTRNIISPASGRPIAVPSQDMVLGLYYLTKGRKNLLGEGLNFSSIEEVIYAYQHGKVDVHASINIRLVEGIVNTTVGRVILFEALPEDSKFEWINKAVKKKDLVKLISRLHKRFGSEATVRTLDKIKHLGFSHATFGGISLSIDNLVIPESKQEILNRSGKEVEKAEKLYLDGAITNGERYNKIIQIWARTTEDVTNDMITVLEHQDREASLNEQKNSVAFNPVFMMLDSGARGSRTQIRQLAAMRGLMAKPSGEIMETPVLANFKEGLNVFEYFVSTHGARKGLADTALKTADSGYLTRRLVDVAQDVVIMQKDCNALGYIAVTDIAESGQVIESLARQVFGRIAAEDIIDPVSAKMLCPRGQLLTEAMVNEIRESSVTEVKVRSVLSCQIKRGVCAMCYGMDLSTHELVEVGVAVGIIAAQSIGEPGTQLTMRTFHVGGTVTGVVEQTAHKAQFTGKVVFREVQAVKNRADVLTVMNRKAKLVIVAEDGRELEELKLGYGALLHVKPNDTVVAGQKLAEWEPSKIILTDKPGVVQYVDLIENVTYQELFDEGTNSSRKTILERREEKRQPYIVVVDQHGIEEGRYYLPTGAI